AQKWVHYTLSHDAFDCGNGKHRDEALISYFSDGTTDRVGPNSLPTPWELVAPDSVGGEVMKFVCTRQRE
ncbi:MAG: surface-adhesin E family protein, partial [Steroidobacteraceae bacterium]